MDVVHKGQTQVKESFCMALNLTAQVDVQILKEIEIKLRTEYSFLSAEEIYFTNGLERE